MLISPGRSMQVLCSVRATILAPCWRTDIGGPRARPHYPAVCSTSGACTNVSSPSHPLDINNIYLLYLLYLLAPRNRSQLVDETASAVASER